jgi:F5/8 type C domain
LGGNHTLHDFTISWEHPDRAYTFKVETSSDDAKYTERSSLSGTGVAQAVLFPSNVSARYVRVTVTAAAPSAATSNGTIYPTWASFFEISVNGF